MAILATKEVVKSFPGVTALDRVSIEIGEGATGLIGPNGSGKTTLFNCIMGELRADTGEIFLDGKRITHLKPYQIVKNGIVRTYQEIQVFPSMTALENLLTAGQHSQGEYVFRALIKSSKVLALEKKLVKRAVEVLDFLGLAKLTIEFAGNLSYGQRKLLSIGMGLMANPRLLLLDEPTAGINPTLIKQITERLLQLKREKYAFCIIEHNIPLVMNLCDRIIVMGSGRRIATGTPEEIQKNPRVIEEYFGRESKS